MREASEEHRMRAVGGAQEGDCSIGHRRCDDTAVHLAPYHSGVLQHLNKKTDAI